MLRRMRQMCRLPIYSCFKTRRVCATQTASKMGIQIEKQNSRNCYIHWKNKGRARKKKRTLKWISLKAFEESSFSQWTPLLFKAFFAVALLREWRERKKRKWRIRKKWVGLYGLWINMTSPLNNALAVNGDFVWLTKRKSFKNIFLFAVSFLE